MPLHACTAEHSPWMHKPSAVPGDVAELGAACILRTWPSTWCLRCAVLGPDNGPRAVRVPGAMSRTVPLGLPVMCDGVHALGG